MKFAINAVLENYVQMRIVVMVDEKSTVAFETKPVGLHRPKETIVSPSRCSVTLGVAHCVKCIVMRVPPLPPLAFSLPERTRKTHLFICFSLPVSPTLSCWPRHTL